MLEKTAFYKPTKAELTKEESAFLANNMADRNKQGMNDPKFDFKLHIEGQPMQTRRIARAGRRVNMDYQITYSFSSKIRNNMFTNIGRNVRTPFLEYGAKGWSFRLLYEFLSDAYNGGEPFLDEYFRTTFFMRPVYWDWSVLWQEIVSEINEELDGLPLKRDGTPDMRRKINKEKFNDFAVWKDGVIFNKCQEIAEKIRKDIIVCLSTMILPLTGRQGNRCSVNTRLIRSRLGEMKSLNAMFYASGRLIEDLSIYVEVSDKGARAA